jgi:hypothetical protein
MSNIDWFIVGLFLGLLLAVAYYNFKDIICNNFKDITCNNLKKLNIFGKKEMQNDAINYQNWDGLNPIDTDSI